MEQLITISAISMTFLSAFTMTIASIEEIHNGMNYMVFIYLFSAFSLLFSAVTLISNLQ